jgi:hypothetical protein
MDGLQTAKGMPGLELTDNPIVNLKEVKNKFEKQAKRAVSRQMIAT